MEKSDCIFINDLMVESKIGIYAEEKILFQPLIVTIKLYGDFKETYKSDNINNAICYETLSNKIAFYTKENSYNLIETLADKLVCLCLHFDKKIETVELTIKKTQAIKNASCCGITIFKKQSNY